MATCPSHLGEGNLFVDCLYRDIQHEHLRLHDSLLDLMIFGCICDVGAFPEQYFPRGNVSLTDYDRNHCRHVIPFRAS